MKSRNSSPERRGQVSRDERAEVEGGTYRVLDPGFEEAPYAKPRSATDSERVRAVARELASSSSRPPPPRSGVVPRMAPIPRLPALDSFGRRVDARRDSDLPGDPLADAAARALSESRVLAFADTSDDPDGSASATAATDEVDDERPSQPDAEPIALMHPKSAIVGARLVRTRTRVYTRTLPFLEPVEGAPTSARVPAPDVIELRSTSSAPPPSGYETPRAFPAAMVAAPSSDAVWVSPAGEARVSLTSAPAHVVPTAPKRASSTLLLVAVAVLVAALAIVLALEIAAHAR